MKYKHVSKVLLFSLPPSVISLLWVTLCYTSSGRSTSNGGGIEEGFLFIDCGNFTKSAGRVCKSLGE